MRRSSSHRGHIVSIPLMVLAASFFLIAPTTQAAPLPEPDIESFETAVIETLREAQAELADALERDAPDAELATAYGELGTRYLAHHLAYAAQPVFAVAANLAPESVRWPYLSAYAFQEQGEFIAALQGYDKTLTIDPGLVAAQLRRAEVLFELGRMDEAETAYRSVLNVQNGNAVALAGLGNVAMQGQQYQSAGELFVAALRVSPQSNQLHYPLSRALARLDRQEEARHQMSLAGQLKPQIDDPILIEVDKRSRSTQFYLERGLALMDAGYEQEAIAAIREAVSLNPDDHFALATLGQALLVAGRKSEAQSVLEEAIERGSVQAATYFHLGTIFESHGDQSAADQLYAKTIATDPGYLEARLLLANSLMRSQRYDDAVLQYRELSEREPDRPLYFYRLAILSQVTGDCVAAIHAIERATELAPTDGDVMQVRSRTWSVCPQASDEQRRRSLEQAELLYEARPGIDMLETLALAYAASGQFGIAARLQSGAADQALREGEQDRADSMRAVTKLYENISVPERAYSDFEPLLRPEPLH